MDTSVLVEFSMFPLDKGESVSKYVSKIIKMLENSNIQYKLTPMGTIFEVSSFEEAIKILNNSYKELENNCNRIYSNVKFDIRKNKKNRIKEKIESIKEKLR